MATDRTRGHPRGIAAGLERLLPDAEVRTATLQEPEHGLSAEVLDATDVLLWWGHAAHDQVDDAVVARVHERVLAGMGIIVLHSGHFSKIFKRLMGDDLCPGLAQRGRTRAGVDREAGHPIAAGKPQPAHRATAGDVRRVLRHPGARRTDLRVVVRGRRVFRSGVTYTRGRGRVFYFRPATRSDPVYQKAEIQQVLANAARWAAPRKASASSRRSRIPRATGICRVSGSGRLTWFVRGP